MSKKSKKAVRVGTGGTCPKDYSKMGRFEHPPGWTPAPGRSHFTTWDKCRKCGHIQHYEQFRVKPLELPAEEIPPELVIVGISIGNRQVQTVAALPAGLDVTAQLEHLVEQISACKAAK